jgi:hypothetical protein
MKTKVGTANAENDRQSTSGEDTVQINETERLVRGFSLGIVIRNMSDDGESTRSRWRGRWRAPDRS